MSAIELDDFPEIPEEAIEQRAADLLEEYAQWSGRPQASCPRGSDR